MLLSRYRAHGLLGAGGQAELWYGVRPARLKASDPPEVVSRAELLDDLAAMAALVPVQVDGVRGLRYVLADEIPILRRSIGQVDRGEPLERPSVAFLAPLDPLAWDRDLMRSLFDFDYVWEVYVPEHKRRWGYYVLPVLWGDRLVGRIEPRIDTRAGVVRMLGLWWQDDFRPRQADGFIDAMRDGLAAYARFAGARRFDWGPLSPAKRLFGTRPRDS
jgi:uncharacterized protein YcaQ